MHIEYYVSPSPKHQLSMIPNKSNWIWLTRFPIHFCTLRVTGDLQNDMRIARTNQVDIPRKNIPSTAVMTPVAGVLPWYQSGGFTRLDLQATPNGYQMSGVRIESIFGRISDNHLDQFFPVSVFSIAWFYPIRGILLYEPLIIKHKMSSGPSIFQWRINTQQQQKQLSN